MLDGLTNMRLIKCFPTSRVRISASLSGIDNCLRGDSMKVITLLMGRRMLEAKL